MSEFPKSRRIMEFLGSVDEFAELCEAFRVMVVDVDCEQLVARVCRDHVEEWSSRLLEINCSPEGGVASASPLGTDVSELEQCLDAIRSDIQ